MREMQALAIPCNDRPLNRNWSRSAIRVRSSALYFVTICRKNFGVLRGLGAKIGANLLQPTKKCFCSNEAMVAQRIDLAHRLYYLDVPLWPA
jgi:hypothetical protein